MLVGGNNLETFILEVGAFKKWFSQAKLQEIFYFT